MPTVVVVDDEQDFRTLLRDFLPAAEGFTIVGEAEDGHQAMDLVQRHSPDVVVMDVQMPEMTGFEATRRIRRLSPKTLVVLVSINDEREFFRQAQEAGAVAFIPKTELSTERLLQVLGHSQPKRNDPS